jgi:hypothetical protein
LSNPEFIMVCKQILNSTLIGTVRVELVLNKSCIEVWPSRYDCEVAAVAFRSQAGCITISDFTGRRDSSGNQRESATLFPQDLSLYSRRAVPLFPQGCPFIPAGLSFYSRRAGAAAPGGI